MNRIKKTQCSRKDCSDRGDVIFRKISIPSTFGDELTGSMKPENGAYKNALVFYEASGVSFLYDSDGVYTKIANIEGQDSGVISVNGKQGVVTITLSELGGMTEAQINALITSKGYQTASQVDIKVNTAKSSAIAESKAYTDTKATTAKNEAISSAKTYTDGKIAQVESEIPTKTSDLTNDSNFQTLSQVNAKVAAEAAARAAAITAVENEIPDVIDNVTSTSSDDALSAKQGKLLNDRIDNIDSRGRYLSTWNATTGEPGTEPEVLPYDYRTGDYFIVATVGSTNYRPNGTQYTGAPSTTVETDTVSPNDTYLYDGTTWELIHTEIPQIAVDENLSTTSRNPVENRTITNALSDIEEDIDGKQDTLTAGDNIDITNNVISATDTTYTAGDNITIENGEISAVIPEKPYISLERNSEYLYTVTFDTLPEETPPANIPAGACSAFVRDGKLYRNLDWYYNNNVSFRIVTKDFEGMSFANGLTNTTLDDEKIAQLPYQVTDGVNRNGIMVSTHILYNDWGATGTGTVPLTKLPFIVLTQVKSMDTLETDLGDVLTNMYVPAAMAEAEYLIQVLVTDGTTTYVLKPGNQPNQSYEAVDITSNPKLTNFLWVNRATVERNGSYMQNRPTGVERYNEIDDDTTLEDLRFTKAYEAPTRLSEFIGIDDTDKDSTDAELEAIYDEAHAEYLIRQRDGKTWQTMHSVVYGPNGIERLHVQENWDKDYAFATREYVDEAIEVIEGEIPELLGSTGQSEVAGMTQKAITDAIEASGGGELAHKLTTADYNYPASNPNSIALWLLEPGVYWRDTNDSLGFVRWVNGSDFENNRDFYTTYIIGGKYGINRTIITLSSESSDLNRAGWIYNVNPTNGNAANYTRILWEKSVVDGLTSTSTWQPLSAKQGKVLKDLIDSLIIKGTGVPTTSTVGTVGKLYEDTTNGKLYQCTAVSGSTYTWTEVGGGGSGVQYSDLFTDGSSQTQVKIGANAVSSGTNSVAIGGGTSPAQASSVSAIAIGFNSKATGTFSTAVGNSSKADATAQGTALGNFATASGNLSVAIGAYSKATERGEFSIGDATRTDLYNGTGYRLLTNVHAPVNDHDAATKKYVDDHSGGGVNVVQTTGTSTTDVMSQKAVTDTIFASAPTSSDVRIRIGSTQTVQANSISIGRNSQAYGQGSIMIGTGRVYSNGAIGIGAEVDDSSMTHQGSIALGYGSGDKIAAPGMMDIGVRSSYASTYGYNGTAYRLLTGVHPGINDNDAVVMSQLNAALDQIQALEARIAALEGNA